MFFCLFVFSKFILAQVDSLNFLLLLFWFILLFSFFYFFIFSKLIPTIVLNFWVRFFFFDTKLKVNYFLCIFYKISFLIKKKNFIKFFFFIFFCNFFII